MFTIGYAGQAHDAVIGRLKAAGVAIVIDVRAIAASRRPGFSKGGLSASLAEAGIDYRHLRALGTPKSGREAAHAGRVGEMHAIYKRHLNTHEAQVELAEAASIAKERPAALLCYEFDAASCHRAIVADRIRDRTGCQVTDL